MTALPDSPSLVQRYFDAWNARDPDAVAAAFAAGGTYTDPTVGGPPLAGSRYRRARARASRRVPRPELRGPRRPASDGQATGTVVARWLMRGTNTGPWNGQPPTGRTVTVRGAEVIAGMDGQVTSAEGYFDRQGLAEQLGFEMRPLPPVADPFQFGYAVRASTGRSTAPGAFSLTWIEARSEAEADEVKLTAAVIATELATQPGFLSWIGLEIGSRLYTITAWDSVDAVREIMRNATHLAAAKRFLSEDFGAAGITGVWSAHHLNPVWTRCPSCARLTDRVQSGDVCGCGAAAAPDA